MSGAANNRVRIGIIAGTGLSEALRSGLIPHAVEVHNINTPFGNPSSPIVTGEYSGASISLLQRHGKGHVLNPAAIPARANVFALKSIGCTHILASGAVGSLRETIRPGDLVICDQLIDKTDGRPKTFFEHAAVHVEFADPFCPIMRQWLLSAAAGVHHVHIHDRGCYLCMEGPSFSTRAESLMHRQWGGDVVGMTALPEARLAREAEIAYAMLALPTDYDAWMPRVPGADQQSLLEEIMGNLQRATQASIELLKAALADISVLQRVPSPAHDALRLAIWSEKTSVAPNEIQRLSPLWGRYFSELHKSH
jgi:5'-methylthioadenosine phosphorylase